MLLAHMAASPKMTTYSTGIVTTHGLLTTV